ncbi:hypothetical protein [Shewanella acanthi]|uniref:hypothetical protein n=1 Tax=Shewanella acanthi TaxID=2864212 RepID=UPI001C65E576|nr:hypothetical protein [Shewanella acanthi]QYJ78808.1 hypothetical protein K0H61_17340 [Shewanella acanthi]
MLSLLNLTITLIDIALLLYVCTAIPSSHRSGQGRSIFLVALLFGMAYDNLVVAAGNWFIGEPWFTPVSMMRFYCHVLTLPFLSLFTYSIIREAGLALGQSKVFLMLSLLVTLSTLIYGISHELVGLQLVETSQLGIQRMTNANGSAPIATIVTNLFTIILSAYLWRKTGWKVLCLGSMFIFVVNAVAAGKPWGFIAGNLVEIVFVLSLIITHQNITTNRYPAKQVTA